MTKELKERIIVAMSGGVDSSVAALLLHEAGYDVIGVTMRLWKSTQKTNKFSKQCCSVDDIEDARMVCDSIGIPHYVFNFENEFQQHVVDYFLREYDRGRTPHPCLACNDRLKFDFLLKKAIMLDAKYVATGHYARILKSGREFQLLKAIDHKKDQSYVLFNLGQKELSKLMFPVGQYNKAQIREFAEQFDLEVATKPDRQEICFIPDGDYKKFIADRNKRSPGLLKSVNGATLGTHPGIQFFTIGQRRGIGLKGGTGSPMHVISIDSESNEVVIGPEEFLYKDKLFASNINLVSGNSSLENGTEVEVKIRYNSQPQAATISLLEGNYAEINFLKPQRAITPGQAVVFYQDEILIGGGFIELSYDYKSEGSLPVRPEPRVNQIIG